MEQRPQSDRHWAWPVSIITLALLLAATASGGALLLLGQQREIRELQADLAEARVALADAQEEARAEAEQDEAPSTPGGGGFGGGLGGLLEDLLEGLGGNGGGGLGGGGGGGLEGLLEGLGGDGQAALFACLSGAMASDEGVRPIADGPARDQVAAIAERVEELRGLSFPDEVDTRFLSGSAFEAEVRERFDEDYSPADATLDERILVALGAIPADFDLRERYLDLISGQAAGFYTTDTQEIVVRADDPSASLSPAEQITLAHELEHALSDAILGLPDLDGADTDGDGARASLSLVEGGATLSMQQYAGTALGPMAQMGMAMDPNVAQAQAQLETFPHHLQRELVFPYEDGLLFACGLHADGGWDAIDDAYDAPPTASAQILFPERYRADAPVSPTFAGGPEGFAEERSTTFGAADLLWLFEAPGGDTAEALDDPRGRAAGWDAGSLRLLTSGADTVIGMALTQRAGERDLCRSVADWYEAAFPGVGSPGADGAERVWDGATQDAVLTCAGTDVRLGIGPDLPRARAGAAG